jgi:hypothetical protein
MSVRIFHFWRNFQLFYKTNADRRVGQHTVQWLGDQGTSYIWQMDYSYANTNSTK